ncbi:glutathione synthase [Phytohabitans kaempferiae]|uniref:Glutathione synthetase n=1 Tax=Phytohabitans kaempferiae TaxID=1620943 RepID=A0ABV6MCG0_9ACTN
MRFLFVVDPLAGLLPGHDTSVALMEAAQRLGMDVWVAGAADLTIARKGVAAWAQPVRIVPAERQQGRWTAPVDWWRAGEQERIDLSAGDAVLMRVDPPVNSDYLRTTFVLDAAVREGALVVNDPRGLREANEKLLSLAVPDLAPETIVTAHAHDIREALERWDPGVAKPLEEMGGRGVVMLRKHDPGVTALIDLVTRRGTRQVVFQEYLAAVAEGDKRIFLLDGEPIGAINRRASHPDFRCNLAVGAVSEETVLDASDLEICRRLRPVLRRLGLALVGIDVIGGRLTEVNVTSPTGLREIELFSDDRPSDRVIGWIANAAAAPEVVRKRSQQSLIS